MIKKLKRGEMCPKFYGFCRRDMLTEEAIVIIIPFNVIAGLLIAITSSLRWWYIDVCTSPRDAYQQGYKARRAKETKND